MTAAVKRPRIGLESGGVVAERVEKGVLARNSADRSKCVGSTSTLGGPGVSESYVTVSRLPQSSPWFASGLRENWHPDYSALDGLWRPDSWVQMITVDLRVCVGVALMPGHETIITFFFFLRRETVITIHRFHGARRPVC